MIYVEVCMQNKQLPIEQSDWSMWYIQMFVRFGEYFVLCLQLWTSDVNQGEEEEDQH